MQRITTIGIITLFVLLAGCSKHVATCWDLGENAHTHAEFGYFYDSLVVDVNGPTTFQHIPADMATNPCAKLPAP